MASNTLLEVFGLLKIIGLKNVWLSNKPQALTRIILYGNALPKNFKKISADSAKLKVNFARDFSQTFPNPTTNAQFS